MGFNSGFKGLTPLKFINHKFNLCNWIPSVKCPDSHPQDGSIQRNSFRFMIPADVQGSRRLVTQTNPTPKELCHLF